jgi:hypothetical protein
MPKSEKHRQHQRQSQSVHIHVEGKLKRKKSKKSRGGGGGVNTNRPSLTLPPTYITYNQFPADSNFGRHNQSYPTPRLIPVAAAENTRDAVPILNPGDRHPAGPALYKMRGWREGEVHYYDDPKPQPDLLSIPSGHSAGRREPSILSSEGKTTPLYENLPSHFTGRAPKPQSLSEYMGFKKADEPVSLVESAMPRAFKSGDFIEQKQSGYESDLTMSEAGHEVKPRKRTGALNVAAYARLHGVSTYKAKKMLQSQEGAEFVRPKALK